MRARRKARPTTMPPSRPPHLRKTEDDPSQKKEHKKGERGEKLHTRGRRPTHRRESFAGEYPSRTPQRLLTRKRCVLKFMLATT